MNRQRNIYRERDKKEYMGLNSKDEENALQIKWADCQIIYQLSNNYTISL